MSLEQVLGQDSAVEQLNQSIKKQRFPSSYLFLGPSGVGKAFTALQFMKAVNQQKTEFTESIKLFSQKKHPDFVIRIRS